MLAGEQLSVLDVSRVAHSNVVPRGMVEPVSRTLPEVVARLVAAVAPVRIVLFGSHVYGSPTPDSDVDLLVVVNDDAPLEDRHLSVARLLRPRSFPVDLIVMTPEEVQSALAANDVLLTEIMARGQVLYERPA